ncbi:unnamed protein product [Fraxinus pennsylvanica]|uniref:U-box domain-containing protein n=1 Tax=Fraxinus pennsylvanica TaxID=56036 RepID=A0AAD2E4H8_9LAMI|nr:unnamed protein product [Fraxinus pennsylvanica]
MAKSGAFEGDPGMVAKAMELKRELQKLVKAIVDEDDDYLGTIDRAEQMLCALKELKVKKSLSSSKIHPHHQDTVSQKIPEEFKCPLSKELMRDPVIVASGQVRNFIFTV